MGERLERGGYAGSGRTQSELPSPPVLAATLAREFNDRFTIFPDTGVTQLHCYRCDSAWAVGYHPSLDVLIDQARAHNQTAHEEVFGA
jgi:hypothetical protein